MTEQEKILEEIKRNLGEERLDEILDSVRSFFSGPGRGARPAPQKVDTNAAMAASDPKPDASTANRAALGSSGVATRMNPPTAGSSGVATRMNPPTAGSSGVATRSVQPSTDALPAAPATSPAPAAAPAQRTGSIRAGLNRAGLGTDQSGVVGGATPADRARPATAAPETSSFAPSNVARRASGNKMAAEPEPGFSGSGGRQVSGAKAAAEPEPGFSGSAGRQLSGAQAAAEPEPGFSKPAAKAPAPRQAAPRQAAPAAPSAPAQPSRSSQMFQAYSDKGDDATSADFFRADRQAQAERKAAPAAKQAPAAPQKPQQSNADYMKSSGMMDEANLEKKIRKMFEQKSAKFNPVAADYQDSSGPNKPVGKSEKEQHHGVAEEILQELGPNRRRKRSVYKTTLGKLEARNWGGNQSTKSRYSEEHTLSEARKAAFEKVKEKKMKGGRTDTGSPADPIDTEPSKPSMTGY